MARPRVFISSTFYDLRQVRADIDIFLEKIGYESIRNEEGDIPYGRDDTLEEYCYQEIKSVDILVSIIGGRFGSESKRDNSSISQIELRTALKERKQVYIFIDKNVIAEYETYLLNKDTEGMKYRYVDDIRIYKFIEEIRGLSSNNNIKGFEASADITSYLKEQLAGLFQRLLEDQIRVREVSLINNLEKTAQTLNKLVTFLSEENKGKEDEINKILMMNHPLVNSIRGKLKIEYNFYIEALADLTKLLIARGYHDTSNLPWLQSDVDGYYEFDNANARKRIRLHDSLFDSDGKLKYIKAIDWNDSWVILEDISIGDDLPF